MSGEYKVGEIVQLKSGGPKMTVQSIGTDNVYCKWFSGSKLNDGHFAVAAIQHAKPEKDAK